MYVAPEARGNKLGAAILDRLELEAGALGIDRLVLETGSRQPEAIQMYERAGFTARDRWGEYADAPHSRCFEKRLDVGDDQHRRMIRRRAGCRRRGSRPTDRRPRAGG